MDKYDKMVEDMIRDNDMFAEFIEQHPEKKEEYKRKLIDEDQGYSDNNYKKEICKVCKNCAYQSKNGYAAPSCEIFKGEVGRPDSFKPMSVRYSEGNCDYFRSIPSLYQ